MANLRIVHSTCSKCGTPHERFRHKCPASPGIWITGCPKCDNRCPVCGVQPALPDKSNHLCTLDEVLAVLTRLRNELSGTVPVMISFDGPAVEGQRGTLVPYMPINEIAWDDDEPGKPVALLCVAEGNHPFGDIIKLRNE